MHLRKCLELVVHRCVGTPEYCSTVLVASPPPVSIHGSREGGHAKPGFTVPHDLAQVQPAAASEGFTEFMHPISRRMHYVE